ncbi:MAG TPA: amidohydrolase [Flavobacteriaceae bacterium]|nr:amidohydrolase [Flavobacteriaceae bacterium]
MKLKLTFLSLCFALISVAQDYRPKNDGVKANNKNFTAITNVKIYVNHNNVIENGTLLIQNGLVVESGQSVNLPKNSYVIDGSGNYIYPSFIDVYSTYGIKDAKPAPGYGRSTQYDSNRSGFYWNDHIRAEQNAISNFEFDEKTAKALLMQGFGLVNTHIKDGVVRGTGALIALDLNGDEAMRILSNKSGQYLSLSRSVQSRQAYPTSIMGSMALLRQLYYDADWYKKGNIKTTDLTLEAFNQNTNLTQIFSAGSRANAIRADKVGDQFDIQYTILGGGDEFERIEAVKNTNATFIIPINFPKPYDVEDPFLADRLELESMREWNQRPANLSALENNEVPFAITMQGLKSPGSFKTNILSAIEHGLSKSEALKALTTVPAQILKNDKVGNLEKGSFANFMMISGDFFESNATVLEHWIRGSRHIFEDLTQKDIRGTYNFMAENDSLTLEITGAKHKPSATITSQQSKRSSTLSYSKDWVQILFTSADTTDQRFLRFNAKITTDASDLNGVLHLRDGSKQALIIKRENKGSEEAKKTENKSKSKENKNTLQPVTYPNGAYGNLKLPEAETLLFKNATVWTNETQGVLKNTDVLVKHGKISAIGQNLNSKKARVIDATGKHLTSGIVDEHSHIAAASINEAGQNSSAEVSIEDVVEADDVDIYRNLSGGVTTIQILHGSANPIGGRSAIIKLKWGMAAEDLIYKNSPKFIKFALGENVKQSNWGGYSRFPQTRMGVEQMYIDYFSRAKAYDMQKKSGKPYRIDAEMEVLAEILNKERFISCHSYIQSEINMLMKVAEKFNFNINTFTHILEGYKLADKMKAHGAGASTFSDWWAYKYEVNDAIPYNAAILNNTGVLTAINSDDAEMSRRLNQETAKAVKYGGASEEDAWKMVTLNPAKLLHIDDKVGSIKIGKDADLVLWSDHPLSVYAKAEKTLIEGATYFDIEGDQQHRAAIKKERNTLIQMLLEAKNKGMKTQPIMVNKKKDMHCDTLDNNEIKY